MPANHLPHSREKGTNVTTPMKSRLLRTAAMALLALSGCSADKGADGAPGRDGAAGAPGIDGQDGQDGQDGLPGSADTASQVLTKFNAATTAGGTTTLGAITAATN